MRHGLDLYGTLALYLLLFVCNRTLQLSPLQYIHSRSPGLRESGSYMVWAQPVCVGFSFQRVFPARRCGVFLMLVL